MRRLSKVILWVFILLLVLMLAAYLALPSIINTDAFKQRLNQQVQETIGHELIIEAPLSTSFYPWLGLKTGSLKLSQPQSLAASSPPLLEVASADIQVRLMPLFKNQLEVEKVVLHQPQINYRVTQSSDSLSNIRQQIPSLQNLPQLIANAMIAGIDIKQGNIDYQNQINKASWSIHDLSISTGNILSAEAGPLDISGVLQTADQQVVDFSLDATASLDLNQAWVELSNMLFTAKYAESTQLSGEVAVIKYDGNLRAWDLTGIEVSADSDTLLPAPIQTTLSIPALSIDLQRQLTSHFVFDLREYEHQLHISGDAMVKEWQHKTMYKGTFAVDNFNPKDICNAFGFNYIPSDEQVFKNASIGSQFNGGINGFSLKAITLQLDETAITGHLSLINFTEPKYHFDLNINHIDLDRYTPKQASPLDLINMSQWLQGTHTQGVLRTDYLSSQGVRLKNMDVAIHANQEGVEVTPLQQP